MCGYEWIAFSWKGRVDCLICRRWLCFFYFGAVRERERERAGVVFCCTQVCADSRGVESRAERLFLLLSDPVESCVMSEKC